MMNYFKIFCLAVCVLILTASCAPKRMPVERPPEVVWGDFRAKTPEYVQGRGFIIRSSISFVTAESRNRFQASIWGFSGHPVRMDLSAGFGRIFSMWLEDELTWQAYFPDERTRYLHSDGSMGAALLGFPIPFNLHETALVLMGYFDVLIPGQYHHVEFENGKWKYHFEDERISSVVLNQAGNLKYVFGEGWRVEFDGLEQKNGLVYFSRLDMQLFDDNQATIRIRSIDLDQDWKPEQLELDLPENIQSVFLY